MCRPKLTSAKPEDQESLQLWWLRKLRRNSERARQVWASEKARYLRASERAKLVWRSEQTQRMIRERWTVRWLGTLFLPMLLIIQPLADYNTRTALVLIFLSWVLWTQYKPLRLRGWQRSLERYCDKCQATMMEQMQLSVRPTAGLRAQWARRLPLRLISRQWGHLANAQLPSYLVMVLLWFYVKLFGCKLHEASRDRLSQYKSLGDFFCRRLKAEARLVASDCLVTSPCDGAVTFKGRFDGGFLQQVKGVHYSLNYFLGLSAHSVLHASGDDLSQVLVHPSKDTALFQWVTYLSPGDYHRFHSPADWQVLTRRHFPGELMSVKPSMVEAYPGLFHLNERVAWLGRWRHGFFSMTAVGATNVGSIHSKFEPDLKTNQALSLRRECVQATGCSKRSFHFNQRSFEDSPLLVTKGEDFGHFSFGSTIVLIFEAPKDFQFAQTLTDRIQMGQKIF